MRAFRLALRQLLLLATLLLSAVSAQPPAPSPAQAQDEDFARAVKEWTTRPEFLSPLVGHLPKSARVPSPKSALGYHVGTPQKLTYYADILKYYRALEAKSPRVKVMSIGKTDEDRECVVVAVGSEDSIKNLEQHRAYLGQLADPRKLSEAEARDVIAKAKPIYHLMGGLHSGETGPSEMLMELAYRLVVEDSPLVNQIRQNVIVTITPVADPDGRDRYVDWYYRHKLDEKTEDDRVVGPPYWGKYIFHDNNRDINYSQVTMRNLLQWYLQWHPPIMHDLHESVPFLYTFSGQAPQQPTLDPILYGELPWFANFEMAQLTKYGMPGVWTHGFVDMWSVGYLGFMSSNHNGMLRMYETFGNGGANTMKRRVAPADGGAGQTSREWYRPSPPYKEVEWSMRNNTNYMQTGVLTALQLTSEFPQVVLENFYRKSRNAIEAGKNEAPYGYVIPVATKRDLTRIELVVNLLLTQGIEVGQAKGDLRLKEGLFPEGTIVIKRNQPYGRLAKILLEKQSFPDPTLRTYDDTGWTLGLMTQTEVVEVADKIILEASVEPIKQPFKTAAVLFKMADNPEGKFFIVPNHGSNSMISVRHRLGDLAVKATGKPFTTGAKHDHLMITFPRGSFVIAKNQSGKNVAEQLKGALNDVSMGFDEVDIPADVPMHDVDLPRLAVYSTWGNTQEVGWVRHALDHFGVKYDLIYKERVKQGGLRGAYDVVLIPNQGRGGKGLVFDIEPKGRPLAYMKTDRFKFLGAYGESEDITGGMGIAGVAEFEKFVNDGGLLITLGQASFFPPEFGLTRQIDASRPSPQFYAPGPIVEAEIMQPAHPIFYGYTEKKIPVRYANGPLLAVPERDRERQVLMRFPGGESSVLSGLMKGVGEIRNRPAVVDVPVGKGRVILFATNPCYRWQNHGEFNLLFNALLHFNDVNDLKPAERK
jgi:hypothetical protein